MENKFCYQSNEYDRQSQRFVIPLYLKDELGNYQYSSTGTLIKYNDLYYIIFSAHALNDNNTLENIYTFFADGIFRKITEFAIGHKIFNDDDIVVVDYFNKYFTGKNYFNLNEEHLNGFEENLFAWTGFPSSKSKSKNVHNTKTIESLQEQYIHSDETGDYFKSASYFTILSKVIENNRDRITGKYERKNALLRYKGKVPMAPHPKGMSGGAMYFFTKGQKLQENLDDTFRFAGIGIEYNEEDDTIIGVSREKIINLLKQFDRDNPLKFYCYVDNQLVEIK